MSCNFIHTRIPGGPLLRILSQNVTDSLLCLINYQSTFMCAL